MVTQMLLLRFQMCAVVNIHLRHRHRKSGMPYVVTITDEPHLSTTTSRIRPSAGAITIAVQLASKRCIVNIYSPSSLPLLQIWKQTGQIFRRQLHAFTDPPAPPRSPFNSHRNAVSPKRYNSNMLHSPPWTASFKHPSIRCYRSSSRYQVTPHRMSCPCLVSFSVGHYDVLVSTPDSMFSVV